MTGETLRALHAKRTSYDGVRRQAKPDRVE